MKSFTKVHLGFHFYGAGNIGDDLMLAGFLHLLKSQMLRAQLTCAIPRDVAPQRHRFPEVEWHGSSRQIETHLIQHSDLWLGVGDTPFQITDGLWLFNHIAGQIELCRRYKKPMAMFGVGVEKEAMREHERVARILDAVELIITRDESSHALLSKVHPSFKNKVLIGADLANVALSRIFSEDLHFGDEKVFDLGVIVDAASLSENDLNQVRAFLCQESSDKRIVFIANEVRSGKRFERNIYSTFIKPRWRIRRTPLGQVGRRVIPRLNRLLSWLSRGINKQVVSLYVPDYFAASIADLVKHYARCKIIISSRYHGVLAAAWAGCRVGAIAGRSKVEFLAKDLNIPYISKPLTVDNLRYLIDSSIPVSRESLKLGHDQCVDTFADLFSWMTQKRNSEKQ
jgi:hypothetical protein